MVIFHLEIAVLKEPNRMNSHCNIISNLLKENMLFTLKEAMSSLQKKTLMNALQDKVYWRAFTHLKDLKVEEIMDKCQNQEQEITLIIQRLVNINL